MSVDRDREQSEPTELQLRLAYAANDILDMKYEPPRTNHERDLGIACCIGGALLGSFARPSWWTVAAFVLVALGWALILHADRPEPPKGRTSDA